jgi:hypothetical protein
VGDVVGKTHERSILSAHSMTLGGTCIRHIGGRGEVHQYRALTDIVVLSLRFRSWNDESKALLD